MINCQSNDASGAKLDVIKKSKPLIHSKKIEVFIEVHIEQGPVLVDRLATCIVTFGFSRGIIGITKYDVKVTLVTQELSRYLRKICFCRS